MRSFFLMKIKPIREYFKAVRPTLPSFERFSNTMADCLKAGLSLEQCVESAMKTSCDPRLKDRQEAILERLADGASVWESMKEFDGLAPRFYAPVVRCGEESGRLEETFTYLAEYCQRLTPIMAAIRKTWLFPLVIIVCGWIGRLLLCAVFLRFDMAFQLGVEILEFWTPIIAIVIAVKMIQPLRERWDALALHLPILRETMIDFNFSRYLKAFNLMYKSGGMDIAHMAHLAADTATNSTLKKEFHRAADRFHSGDSFSEVFNDLGYIHDSQLHIIAAGDVAGKLEEAFQKSSKISDGQLTHRLDIVNQLLWYFVAMGVSLSLAFTVAMLVMSKP
jgi:type II secretory pathway component PulF